MTPRIVIAGTHSGVGKTTVATEHEFRYSVIDPMPGHFGSCPAFAERLVGECARFGAPETE